MPNTYGGAAVLGVAAEWVWQQHNQGNESSSGVSAKGDPGIGCDGFWDLLCGTGQS